MTTLAGTKVKDTYRKILQVSNATTGLTGSLQYLQDGDGTNTPIQISTSAVSIDALTATSTFTASGNIVVSGTVDGRDLAVDGAKLDLIEDNADVTDNTNVLAALAGSESTIANQADALPTSATTTGTFADARISESSVTQHEAALSITESQISDFGTYSTTSHTHAASDTVSGTFADARISESSVTQHEAALSITESQISDLTGVTAGNRVLLSAQTADDDATIDFDNLLDSTYDRYEIEIIGMVPATSGGQPRLRVGTGATPTYVTSTSYRSSSSDLDYLPLASTSTSVSDISNAAGECFHRIMMIFSPADTSLYTYIGDGNAWTDNSTGTVYGFGVYEATTAVTSLRVYFSTGNITSGTISLFGIKK